MSKRTILKGTLILTAAGIITKLLGFYNRIFLTRLIGVKELGVYQLIFPLYLLAFSFCCQGIATTLTKQVSYYIGKRTPENAHKAFLYSITISLSLSLFVAVGINVLAYPLSLHLLKNTDCAPLLKIISIAIPFVSIKACINSYFMGNEKPGYHGISHLIEQIIRIGSAYILAALWSADKVNATLAVTAVVIGELSAALLSSILYACFKKKQRRQSRRHPASKKEAASSYVLHSLLRDAIPITANNMMLTLFSSLEAIIMPAMLYYYYSDRDTAMEMFGIVTGIVIPFLLFPSTITTSLSTMLLPAVSYANARQDKHAISAAIKNSAAFCLLLGVCAWIGYMVLGEWACSFAFKSEQAGTLLVKMSYLCPLIYLSGNLSAILNGLDMAFYNLICNIISIGIRILCSVTLVPVYGLSAYILGMTISYIVLDILLLSSVKREGRRKTDGLTYNRPKVINRL